MQETSLTMTDWIGVACLLYVLVTLAIVGLRPKALWEIDKIQGFISLMGETGARAFIGLWGLLVGAIGVWLLWG